MRGDTPAMVEQFGEADLSPRIGNVLLWTGQLFFPEGQLKLQHSFQTDQIPLSKTENEVENHGESAGAASGERRPSLVMLQNMVKKVSKSSFNNQYKTLVSSASDSSGSSVNDSRSTQDGGFLSDLSAAAINVTDNHQLHLGQNGLKKEDNHLSAAAKEFGGKGRVMEDVGRRTSLNTIFLPPPDYQSSLLDHHTETKTMENVAKFSAPQKDIFQAPTTSCSQGLYQMSLGQNASADSQLHDVALNSPDLFNPVPAQRLNLSKTVQVKNSDLFKDQGLFQAAKGENSLHTERTGEVNLFDKSHSIFVDPLKSPANMEDDLFRSPQPTVVNQFHIAPTNGTDLFQVLPNEAGELFSTQETIQGPFPKDNPLGTSTKQNMDVFSPLSADAVDPFPSPTTKDLIQDFSSLDDPFSPTPSKPYNPFRDVSSGTPDIFQPPSSKTISKDVLEITLNASEMKLDMQQSLDLFKAMPSESHPTILPKSFDRPVDIVLTTPQGTKLDILQPTPFTRARNLSMSPSQSSEMSHVATIKRPPKPLPRSMPPRREKPPRPEKPPKPEQPPIPMLPIEPEPAVPNTSPKPAFRRFPKQVFHRKPKPMEGKSIEPENYVVFEDILLIGQEKCVEDWPEDSPQLNPDFKPSGTLKLRRESLKSKADSDGGSGEDQDGCGSNSKKKDKKFRMSLLPRRGSRDAFPDDTKDTRSRTLPTLRKSSKEYFSDTHMSAGENEDTEQNGIDLKPLRTKVTQLLRRASTTSSLPEGKHTNVHLPQESEDDDINKKSVSKKDSIRRWSEGTVLDDSTGEDEEGGEAQREEVDNREFKGKKRLKIKFVPQRGFAIMKSDNDLRGAHGYTSSKGSKEKSQDELFGTYTPRKTSQDKTFGDVEQLEGYSLKSTNKDVQLQRTCQMSAGFSEDPFGKEDCKPKKSKHKGPIPIPRKPKSGNGQPEPIRFSHHTPQQASRDVFAGDDVTQTGRGYTSPGAMSDSEQDEVETCKPKKTSKLKGLKKPKAKSKAVNLDREDPPGATSADHLSEAAKAEWLAAQMDDRAMAGLEDEDEEGDTDSLMEWWYTVEQWDEVPSDDEDKVLKEDESRSFSILANKAHRGLRVFNKVFTERAEVLWQSIITLHAIADDISNFHHKAKIAGITGGTTTAVGGVTAIAGLALAPFTFGASLVVTAVGVGVATAGGITSASAAISDNVNNMHDRKKVETVLEEYEGHLLDIGKILHFVNQGLYRLRGHPFLRSGTQHYSSDWEIRRAVQMISLVDSPVMRAVEITDAAIASVKGLFQGMDKYFIKDSRELKKGCKKEVVAQIKEVATVLNDGIVELNAIREELQDATGSI